MYDVLVFVAVLVSPTGKEFYTGGRGGVSVGHAKDIAIKARLKRKK